MARCMQFDDQDRQALERLGEFSISQDGETASISGDMKVAIVRPQQKGDQQLWLTLTLPGGEDLDLVMDHAMLLAAAGMGSDSQ